MFHRTGLISPAWEEVTLEESQSCDRLSNKAFPQVWILWNRLPLASNPPNPSLLTNGIARCPRWDCSGYRKLCNSRSPLSARCIETEQIWRSPSDSLHRPTRPYFIKRSNTEMFSFLRTTSLLESVSKLFLNLSSSAFAWSTSRPLLPTRQIFLYYGRSQYAFYSICVALFFASPPCRLFTPRREKYCFLECRKNS